MNDKEKLISLLILTDPNPYTCESESESGSCELTTCTECRARSTADLLIANGVTVQEWISVKDRLPEDSGYYLVVYRDKYNGISSIALDNYVKCNVGEWWGSEFACDITKQFLWATKLQEQEVTHWMPLPETPKGE